MKFVQPKPI